MNFFLHTATTVMHLFMLQAAEVQLEWKVTEATEPLRNVDTGRKSIYYDRHIVVTGQDWSYDQWGRFCASAQMENCGMGHMHSCFKLPVCHNLLKMCSWYFHASLAKLPPWLFLLGQTQVLTLSPHFDQLKMRSASPRGTNSFMNVTGSCQAHFLIPHFFPLLPVQIRAAL